MRVLSELEGVCLGLVRKAQPCTAYQMRRTLTDSPSSHWQASAGSVYPLMRRLEKAGLVLTTADENDGRWRKLLSVTPQGNKALKKWISSGSRPDLVTAMMDPVRSRMFFLDVLSPDQRLVYIEEVISQMEQHFERTRQRLESSPENDDLFGYLGALGAMQVTAARLEWLKRAVSCIKRANLKT